MPRRPWTAAERKAADLRMKAAWRKRKRLGRVTQTAATVMNGHVQVPYPLARLLALEPVDYHHPDQYAEMQGLARSLLRVMMPKAE